MNKMKFIHISSDEIDSITHEMFFDYTDEIIGKSNPLNGERSFVLCIIEQIVALLKRDSKDDKMIITHIQTLLRASLSHNEYQNYLKFIAPAKIAQHKDLEPLSDIERYVLHELIQSNYHEYLWKSDFVSCCYTAMNAFLISAYCIISKGLNQHISTIDITVDIYDTVIDITLTLVETKPDVILVDWHSINKINDLYMLYLTQYAGLEKSSILDLVSADVIEKEYYTKDERFTIAPSILMKQYLSIIEREVNIIIQLSKLPNTENKHYNWYDMKNFVKKRGIELEYVPFRLYKALDAQYKFRNESMHGETDITNEDYEILLSYKNQNLFMGLSVKKLELKGIVIHPTVEEIGEYTGIAPKSTIANESIKKE